MRALRGGGARPGPRARLARAAGARRLPGPPRARAVRRGGSGGHGRAGVGADRRAARGRHLPARARPGRARRLRRARAPRRRPAVAASGRGGRGGGPVTRRATLRGAARTPLDGGADVIVCGASFAGLAVARELAGSGADVLVLDRYEIGERQTSACAAPTPWLQAMGVERAIRQELPCMAFHTPHGSARFRLPWTWSSFDYRELCRALWQQCDARFEIAKVEGRGGEAPATRASAPQGAAGCDISVATDRGTL